MYFWPVLHEGRCRAASVSFTDEHAVIEMHDGRVIGVPLRRFPLLEAATDEQRRNVDLLGDTVYWDDIDDGIDLRAMLSGLYIKTSEAYLDELRRKIAERDAVPA